MNRRGLRSFGIVSAIGGGLTFVVLLCLGVALVRSIKPILQLTEEARAAATQSAVPPVTEAPTTMLTATPLSPTGIPISTDTQLPTVSPIPTETLSPTGMPSPSLTPTGTLPPPDIPSPSPTPTGTLPSTDTPGPSPTPTDTPSPDSTPAPVVIRGITDYVTANGERHVVGEVTNGTSGSICFVKVVGTFYDAAGQVVITDSLYTMLDIVGAGEAAPFDLALLELSPSIDHYDLQLEYASTDSPPLRVDIASHQGSVSDTGSYHVVGEVRNQNAFAVNFVKVVVTFYNAQHEVVRADFSNTAQDMLSPGQKAPFDVALLDPPADMDHYAVKAQAYQ